MPGLFAIVPLMFADLLVRDRIYRLNVVVVDPSASVWARHRKLCCTSVANDCG